MDALSFSGDQTASKPWERFHLSPAYSMFWHVWLMLGDLVGQGDVCFERFELGIQRTLMGLYRNQSRKITAEATKEWKVLSAHR